MSQWNNSYAYNNQYQGASTWNGDAHGQYGNQAFYPNPNNQYVSFNEFLSQMQTNNVPAANAANYNNIQYQNYPVNQYNYQNMPSSTQNAQLDSYSYTPVPNVASEESYQAQSQYNPVMPETNSFTNEMVIKSNLTPTAMEFVPKYSNVKNSSSSQNAQAESSITYNDIKDSKISHGSSSDKNWRERPQSSQQNDSARPSDIYRHNETNRYESNNHSYKNHDSNGYSRESNSSNRNREYDSRNNESSSRTYESNRRNYESNSRNIEPSSQNESTSRNQEYNGRNSETTSRSYEPSNRNPESSNRYNDNRGQSKSKSKTNKDSERTFYNSSINKSTQDVRSGRGEGSGRKNWVGSQRLRAVDRNVIEDEQYANTYVQGREGREERERDRAPKVDVVASPIKKNKEVVIQGGNAMTQRERLSEQLDKGTLECLVCCERVKQTDSVWSCANCYHVMHLRCIRRWALSSVVECKWRCPACQNTSEEVPSEYKCMCGATRSPEYHRGAGGAHTCFKTCQRARACVHPCLLKCHPGPCPPCQATVTKQCGCGAEDRSVICSNKTAQVCGRPCARALACGVHTCARECHEGPCDPCAETITQVCYCMAGLSRTVACSAEYGGAGASREAWSCGGRCSRVLPCGVHVCARVCHPPDCPPCPLLPEYIDTCPCGKIQLEEGKRQACTDPIPVCGNICARALPCGPAGDKHFCKQDCHEGACAPCPDKTLLQCRCGHSSREVPCDELPAMLNNVLCQKKCNKKLSCGRHRCRAVCCAAVSHRCAAPCGRTLSCQLHRCEEFCHTGHCAPCPIVSFDELTCECGMEVLLPPVRCGAKPPPCTATCRRARPCGHQPHHSCHSGDCPPCVVLTTKMCYGRHEERKTIPCSQEEFSCGLPCGKPLPCGKHNCIKTCHKGPCDTGKCTQPCNEKRPSCGHACAAPCHAGAAGACPSAAACRRVVRATCPCGRRHADRACADNARDLAKIMSTLVATKMQEGGSVDLSDVQRPGAMLKTLECDDECRVEARTRQLALALQIRNPDVSAKLAPRYSDHVRTTAAKEPAFAHQVHDRLTELVQLAKKSKQKTRSHSFPSMNWQKRQFIHELCEHFGCESVAYDAEPNRNVVATADKEKSWLPAMSVLEVLAREAGKRRVPGPILRAPPNQSAGSTAPSTPTSNSKSSGGWATLTSTNAWAARSQARQATQPSQASQLTFTSQPTPPGPEKIDYFDNPPEN